MELTNIISNGSKFYGEPLDSIDDLLEVMKTEPLDPNFEKFGNFCSLYAELVSNKPNPYKYTFFGNFFTVSHVFDIETNDEELAEKLLAAIVENKRTDAYKKAKVARGLK